VGKGAVWSWGEGEDRLMGEGGERGESTNEERRGREGSGKGVLGGGKARVRADATSG